jgi:hypothetical protein
MLSPEELQAYYTEFGMSPDSIPEEIDKEWYFKGRASRRPFLLHSKKLGEKSIDFVEAELGPGYGYMAAVKQLVTQDNMLTEFMRERMKVKLYSFEPQSRLIRNDGCEFSIKDLVSKREITMQVYTMRIMVALGQFEIFRQIESILASIFEVTASETSGTSTETFYVQMNPDKSLHFDQSVIKRMAEIILEGNDNDIYFAYVSAEYKKLLSKKIAAEKESKGVIGGFLDWFRGAAVSGGDGTQMSKRLNSEVLGEIASNADRWTDIIALSYTSKSMYDTIVGSREYLALAFVQKHYPYIARTVGERKDVSWVSLVYGLDYHYLQLELYGTDNNIKGVIVLNTRFHAKRDPREFDFKRGKHFIKIFDSVDNIETEGDNL